MRALEKWRQIEKTGHSYDLLIVDLRMPRMDGETLIQEIRKLNADVPLIVLTGHGELSNAYGLLKEFQISDFLHKPLEHPAVILFSVENALEKNRLKKALKQINQELEFRVEERTAALQKANTELKQEMDAHRKAKQEQLELEKQLLHAQKLEALGTLTGGIAHDFNSILAAMMGYTELLLRMVPHHGKEYDYLKRVYQAGIRGKNLVRQILTFSRKKQPQLKYLDVIPLVKETLAMMRATLPTSIEFQIQMPDECRVILVDPNQFQQVLVNLCTNALHAMEDHGGVIRIEIEEWVTSSNQYPSQQFEEGEYLRITIRDSGVGMDKKIVERIFEPFFSTKEIGKGTGLGLSVVYGIIEKHGGKILVESELGKGSAFMVFFPILDKAAEPEENAEPIQDALEGNEKILVLDDELEFARFVEISLKNNGYQVTVQQDSRSALKQLIENSSYFDLIITDLIMPHLSGLELSAKINALRPNLPILLMSGYEDQLLSSQDLEEIGIKKIIHKPFNIFKLLKNVKQVLTESKRVTKSS